MSIAKRPIPLRDEITAHLMVWLADSDWKALPPPLKAALVTASNEIRVAQAVGKYCGPATADDDSANAARRRFIAVFKSRFVAYAGFESSETTDSAGMFVVSTLLKKLKSAGADGVEYLDWFFDDFMGDEYNKKKFAPPTIKLACTGFVVDKFLFQNHDRLRIRQRDIEEYARKNAIITMGMEHLQTLPEGAVRNAFGTKLQSFAEGKLSMRKFAEIFGAVLATGDPARKIAFENLMKEEASGNG